MLGVHSLAPAKLYVGTSTSKQKPTIRRVPSEDDDAATGVHRPPHCSTASPPPTSADAVSLAGSQHSMAEARDPSISVPSSDEPSQVLAPADPRFSVLAESTTTAAAGPSRPVSQIPQIQLFPADPDISVPSARPDDAPVNAIAYRRDPETVIAYMAPLPLPSVQGQPLAVPRKYFLYAPPPPHLVKPAHGSEGYAVKLTRHWQQSVRRAKINAHNGKKVSWKGTRSKTMRGCVWGLNKLKYDDVAFLARIHPKTVAHLILIHPSDLAAAQTPEDILSTFRAQMVASKKRAQRNSIISAALFLPALAIDTAAVFFGGLAEIDGIWMLVSITAYRTARLITNKMGPDPKTMDMSHEQLLQDANTLHPPRDKPESDDESDTGAIRRSVDALRRGVGSIKHRISVKGPRRGRKSESNDRVSSDTSRTPRASVGFARAELANHAEEAPVENAATTTPAAAPSPPAGEEVSGMLAHRVEEEEEEEEPQQESAEVAPAAATTTTTRPAHGGIFQESNASGDDTSRESGDDRLLGARSQNFQLTFCPSPAMTVLDQYMQTRCHARNGQAFPDGTGAPTEAQVLAVMGWRPERRAHLTAEQQQEDEEWQAREVADDLRLVATKAANEWDKACRKQARQSRRSGSGTKVGFAKKLPFGRSQGGTAKKSSSSSSSSSNGEKVTTGKTPGLKQRLAAMRRQPAQKEEGENGTRAAPSSGVAGKAAQTAALLFVPCLAVSRRLSSRSKRADNEDNNGLSERKKKKKPTLQDRLAARSASKRKRNGANPPEDADAPVNEDVAAHNSSSSSSGGGGGGGRIKVKTGLWAGLAASIKGKVPRRKGASRTTASSSPSEKPKSGAFSALKERIKALRTRVVKVRSKLGMGVRGRRRDQQADRDGGDGKTHSAMSVAGLVAGCLALPGAKARDFKERPKAGKANPNDLGNATDPTTATATATATATTTTSPTAPEMTQQSTAPVSAQETAALTPQPPVPMAQEEEEQQQQQQQGAGEGEAAAPTTHVPETQYLPGHGQSEIPVAVERDAPHGVLPAPPAPDETPTAPPATSSPSAAAVSRLRLLRDGLASRARPRASEDRAATPVGAEAAAEEAAATTTTTLLRPEHPSSGPNSPLAPLGRHPFPFRFFRGAEPSGPQQQGQGQEEEVVRHSPLGTSAATTTTTTGAAPSSTEQAGPPHEALAVGAGAALPSEETTAAAADAENTTTRAGVVARNGFAQRLGGLRRKNEEDVDGAQEKPRTFKDRKPGFVERMRVIWYMS